MCATPAKRGSAGPTIRPERARGEGKELGPPGGAGDGARLPCNCLSESNCLGRFFRAEPNPGSGDSVRNCHLHICQRHRRLSYFRQTQRHFHVVSAHGDDRDLSVQSCRKQLHLNGDVHTHPAQGHDPRQIHRPGAPSRNSRTIGRHLRNPRAAVAVAVTVAFTFTVAHALGVANTPAAANTFAITDIIAVAFTFTVIFAFAFSDTSNHYSSPDPPAKSDLDARPAGGSKPDGDDRLRRWGRVVSLPFPQPQAVRADCRGDTSRRSRTTRWRAGAGPRVVRQPADRRDVPQHPSPDQAAWARKPSVSDRSRCAAGRRHVLRPPAGKNRCGAGTDGHSIGPADPHVPGELAPKRR